MCKVKIGLIFFAALNVAACGGGGGSSSNNSAPTTADVQGTWSGTYSISGGSSNVPVTSVIEQGGYGFFLDSQGVLYVLPSLSGNSPVSGTVTAYAPVGYTFQNGQTQEQFSLTATVSSSAIGGTFTGNGETGSFSLTPYTPFPGTPSIIAGQWQGYYGGSGASAVDITVNANGSFSGNDALGCSITGSFTQVGNANLFSVSVTSTGAGCAGNLNGLAFESSTDYFNLFGGAAGIYYYVGVSNSSAAFVAELKAP